MRVLVTRPEPVASHTASELTALGFQPVVLPMTRIEPVATEAIVDHSVPPNDPTRLASGEPRRHDPPSVSASPSHLSPCPGERIAGRDDGVSDGSVASNGTAYPLPRAGGEVARQSRDGEGVLPRRSKDDRSIPAAQDINAKPFAAVAITSANALRHASEELLAGIRHLPCFAVGDTTAETARRRGFADIRQGNGNAAGLAQTLIEYSEPGSSILCLCGRLRRPTFEDELEAAGIAVTPVETYDTLAIDYTVEELAERIGAEPIDLALLYSAESAMALLRLIESVTSPTLPRRFVCISPRVAALLSAEGLETAIASEPSEASMLSALRDISSAEP